MKRGETICYYRARGGAKNIYITMLYDKDQLRGSIIEKNKTNPILVAEKKSSSVLA